MSDRLPGQIDPPQAHSAAHDHQAQRLERILLSTDDAMVWAVEFCKLFSGKMIAADELSSAEHGPVTPGTMVGWFANAMQTAITMAEQRKTEASDAQKQAFVEGFEEGRPE